MTLIEEAIAAGHGIYALLRGRREALNYFNLTLHGLTGSFIALIVVFALSLLLSRVLTPADVPFHIWQPLVSTVISYLALYLIIDAMLKQFGHGDKLIAYLVVNNWSGALWSVLLPVTLIIGQVPAVFWTLGMLVAIIIVEVNMVRFIIGLNLWRMVVFLVGQVAGALIMAPIISAGLQMISGSS